MIRLVDIGVSETRLRLDMRDEVRGRFDATADEVHPFVRGASRLPPSDTNPSDSQAVLSAGRASNLRFFSKPDS